MLRLLRAGEVSLNARLNPGPTPSTQRLSAQQRRAALKHPGRDRLITLTEHVGLEVGDKRASENHVSTLLRTWSLDFALLLRLLHPRRQT